MDVSEVLGDAHKLASLVWEKLMTMESSPIIDFDGDQLFIVNDTRDELWSLIRNVDGTYTTPRFLGASPKNLIREEGTKMAGPTKQVIRDRDLDTTYEDLCSVEIGATAKGDAQIKSVKVYAANSDDAADQALATFRRLQAAMEGATGATGATEAAIGREWATDNAVENS